MSGDDVQAYLSAPANSKILQWVNFWNGNRVRGDLEKLATRFAFRLYDTLLKAAVERHGECPPRRMSLAHPGLIILYTPPQPGIQAWRQIVAAELTTGMAEGRKVLRDKCLGQIARRPWLKTFAPLMLADCVAVDRHGIGLFVQTSVAFDLGRPSVQVRPLKEVGLNLDELERASTRRPRVKRR